MEVQPALPGYEPHRLEWLHVSWPPANTVASIVIRAARITGISEAEIYGDGRRRSLCRPRFAVAWAAREKGIGLAQIGRVLHRDHTTIMSAVDRATHWRAIDAAFKALTEELLR